MPTVILRSLPARVGTVLVILASLIPVWVVWTADGWGNALRAASWAALADAAVWLLWWRPQARLHQEALEVRNTMRSWTVPWDRVEGTQARWGLVLLLRGEGESVQRLSVATAPRGGLLTQARGGRSGPAVRAELTTPLEDASRQAVAEHRVHLECVDAAHLVELYQAERETYLSRPGRDSQGLGQTAQAGAEQVRGRWDVSAVVVPLLALVAVGATSLLP